MNTTKKTLIKENRKSQNPNFEKSTLKLTEIKKIFLLSILLFQMIAKIMAQSNEIGL